MFKWSRLCLVFLGLSLLCLVDAKAASTTPKSHDRAAVSGTVVDTAGNPVAGAIVHVQPPPGAKQAATTQPANHWRKHQPITTDAKGQFTLPHVKLGQHTIVAVERGVGRGETSVDVIAGGVSNVTITLNPKTPK